MTAVGLFEPVEDDEETTEERDEIVGGVFGCTGAVATECGDDDPEGEDAKLAPVGSVAGNFNFEVNSSDGAVRMALSLFFTVARDGELVDAEDEDETDAAESARSGGELVDGADAPVGDETATSTLLLVLVLLLVADFLVPNNRLMLEGFNKACSSCSSAPASPMAPITRVLIEARL